MFNERLLTVEDNGATVVPIFGVDNGIDGRGAKGAGTKGPEQRKVVHSWHMSAVQCLVVQCLVVLTGSAAWWVERPLNTKGIGPTGVLTAALVISGVVVVLSL